MLHDTEIKMPTFMAEVTQKSAIIFTHINTRGFPIHHICFNGIHGDQAIGMPG